MFDSEPSSLVILFAWYISILHFLLCFSCSHIWFLNYFERRVGRISFRYFEVSCFDPVSISFESPFLPISSHLSFRVIMSDLSAIWFWSFHLNIFSYFSLLCTSACRRSFFNGNFSLIFHPGFVFLFEFLWEHRFYHRLVSFQHECARLAQRCCKLGYFLRICLPFKWMLLHSSIQSWFSLSTLNLLSSCINFGFMVLEYVVSFFFFILSFIIVEGLLHFSIFNFNSSWGLFLIVFMTYLCTYF